MIHAMQDNHAVKIKYNLYSEINEMLIFIIVTNIYYSIIN